MNAPEKLPSVQTGYIGKSEPRPNAKRLLQGRGAYVDDLRFPRLAHVVYFRSPYAHAMLKKLDLSKARAQPGVIATVDGRALAEYCTPWVGVLAHLKGIKSPPQHAIAIERACWQGEAMAAIVAETRAQAEDALAHVEAEWQELPVVTDMEAALRGDTVIHPEYGDNICFKRELSAGEVDAAFAKADVVVEETYDFGRIDIPECTIDCRDMTVYCRMGIDEQRCSELFSYLTKRDFLGIEDITSVLKPVHCLLLNK